jgi:hypothetical protein
MAGYLPGHFEKDNFNIHHHTCTDVPPVWQPRVYEGPANCDVMACQQPGGINAIWFPGYVPEQPPEKAVTPWQGQAVLIILSGILLYVLRD